VRQRVARAISVAIGFGAPRALGIAARLR